MKRILAFILLSLMLLSTIVACAEDDPETTTAGTTTATPGGELPPATGESVDIVIATATAPLFKIVYGAGASSTLVNNVKKELDQKTGLSFELVKAADCTDAADAKLMLFGDTNFAESNVKEGMRNMDWTFHYINNKIVFNGENVATEELKNFYTGFSTNLTQNAAGQWVLRFTAKKSNVSYAWNTVTLGGVDLSKYTIVYGTTKHTGTAALATSIRSANQRAANAVKEQIKSKYGYNLTVTDDTAAETANEILIGFTNRSASSTLKTALASYGSYKGMNTIAYKQTGTKLAIYANINNAVINFWNDQKATSEANPNTISPVSTVDEPRVFGILRAGEYFGKMLSEFVKTSDDGAKNNYAVTTTKTCYYDTIQAKGTDKPDGTDVRIMSANLESEDWIGGGDGYGSTLRKNYYQYATTRISALMHTLEMYQPDVVGLQEVDDGWYAALTSAIQNTDWKAACTVSGAQNSKNNYCMFLYNSKTVKYVDNSWDITKYSTNNAPQARILSIARFQVKGANNKQIVVMNTHWDTLRDAYFSTDTANRLTEAQTMANKIQEYWGNGYKYIFCTGDFNTTSITYDTTDPNNPVVKTCPTTQESHGYVSQAPYSTFINGIKSTGMTDSFFTAPKNDMYATVGMVGVDHIFATAAAQPLRYNVARMRSQYEVVSDHQAHFCDYKLN